MTIEERIKGRRIGIIGMARSGMAAATLADSFGGLPFVSDSKDGALLTHQVDSLKALNIPCETGGHTDRVLDCDYIVISPGVPLSVDIVAGAARKGIPVFSEIEFASWVCRGSIVAITGSNGKTTTTTLIGEIFTAAGYETFVAGNIGKPFSDIVQRVPEDGFAVVEVSNFQLESIEEFAPETALILNLTPDHLDRHRTFENYKQIKYRVTENQSENDTLILNLEDKQLTTDQITTRANKQFFTTKDSSTAGAFVRDGFLFGRQAGTEMRIIKCEHILIPGPHNLQNAAAAVCAAMKYDIRPEVIAGVLKKFPGVEHRMERLPQIAGINFVNDSKATNVDSVCYAIRSIETPIYLIAGGRDKGGDFTPIIQIGKRRIKGIIAIGEAREKIFNTLGHVFPVEFAASIDEAVRKSFDAATPGETVMLSPGCASFDMFENFEHRGRVFKEAVSKLKNGKSANETVS